MKSYLLSAAASILTAFASPAFADITPLHLYALGEEGSFVNDLAQDSIGTAHFTDGNVVGIGTNEPSPVSASYAVFNGINDYQFAADLSTVPIDNFAAELWVRVPAVNQTSGLFATGRREDGSLRFHLENGYWAASYKGVGWIGANAGVAPSQVATPNVWTHLAVIRSQGISTFYINGIAQAGMLEDEPFHAANGHLAVFSGGIQSLGGHLDHIRIFSFDPITDNPVAALTFNQGNTNPEISMGIEIRQPGSRVILTWSQAAGASAVPQQSPNLQAPWTPITDLPTLNGDKYELDLGTPSGSQFFRLAYP